MIAAYSPLVSLILVAIWLTVAIIFRYSSLAALTAIASLPVIYVIQGESAIKISFGIILSALIVFKHKANIKKLMSGSESRIGKGKRS